MALFHLYAELVLMPSSIRVGFGPTGALAAGFDRFPPQLQGHSANAQLLSV
jgi:hypothetical protein